MKIILLLLLFPLSIYGQELNLLSTTHNTTFSKIGESENVLYYVHSEKSPVGPGGVVTEKLNYVKISTSTQKSEVFEIGKFKLEGGSNLNLKKQFVHDGYLYEYYLGSKAGLLTTTKKQFLVKKSLDDFSVIEFKELPEYVLDVFFTDENIYIEKTGNTKFLLKYGFGAACLNYSFEEVWNIEFEEVENKSLRSHKTFFLESSQSFIFQFDLAECEDCGIFKKKKAFNESLIALVIFDKDGNKRTVIPEFKEELIYSNVNYLIEENDLIGIFDTHYKGETDYENVEGQGFAFFKWNMETGEIINNYDLRFTYETFGHPDDLGDNYPKLKNSKCKLIQLENGDINLFYSSLAITRKDKDDKTPSLPGSITIPLSENGEPKDIFPALTNLYSQRIYTKTHQDKMFFVGEFYDIEQKKRIFAGGHINLSDGTFDTFEIGDKTDNYVGIVKGFCGYNPKSGTYTFSTSDISSKKKLINYEIITP